MVTTATRVDRRYARHAETVSEVLDVAVDIMSSDGVAGLSIGEIARRMGMRPPSLYVYFPSKHALYDAVFQRGAETVLAAMEEQAMPLLDRMQTAEAILLAAARAFVRWTVENQAYTQLLYWRPVPGFHPSAAAYAPALQLVRRNMEVFAQLQRRRLISDRVGTQQLQRDWSVLIAGVVSQQLANAPDEPFERGRYVAALPQLVRMFIAEYGTTPSGQVRKRLTSRTKSHVVGRSKR